MGVQAWYVQTECLGIFSRHGPHSDGRTIADWKVPHREQTYNRICAGNHAVTRFVRPLVKAVGSTRPGPPWRWVTRRITYEHGSGSLVANEPEPGTGLLQDWTPKKVDRQLPVRIPKDTITEFYSVEKKSVVQKLLSSLPWQRSPLR